MAFFHDRPGGIVAAGSGTLVRCGPVEGVLTCAHVLSDIRRRAERDRPAKIALTVCTAGTARIQAIGMPLSQVAKLPMKVIQGRTDAKSDHPNGPDLGFVRPPPNTMSPPASMGSTLCLAAQAAMKGKSFEPGVERIYLAYGTPAEYGETPAPMFGHPVVAAGTGIVCGRLHDEAPMMGSTESDLSQPACALIQSRMRE